MDPAVLRLLIEPLDLGADLRAISLDLAEEGAESPANGPITVPVWSAVIPALAGDEPWVLDFVSHLDRVKDFCESHGIVCYEPAARCIVIPEPAPEKLMALVERFQDETFGFRVGGPLVSGDVTNVADATVENELSSRGMDAYHKAYRRYSLCAICDFENGSLTVLTEKLASSEILRRVRPVLTPLGVQVERPN